MEHKSPPQEEVTKQPSNDLFGGFANLAELEAARNANIENHRGLERQLREKHRTEQAELKAKQELESSGLKTRIATDITLEPCENRKVMEALAFKDNLVQNFRSLLNVEHGYHYFALRLAYKLVRGEDLFSSPIALGKRKYDPIGESFTNEEVAAIAKKAAEEAGLTQTAFDTMVEARKQKHRPGGIDQVPTMDETTIQQVLDPAKDDEYPAWPKKMS